MVLASDTDAPKLTAHFVDTAKADSIIVVSAPPNIKNAVWGGLMSAGAIGRSARGVVISGRCRDITEHGNLGFPVFSKGHSTLGQSPFTRPSAIEVPITISQDDFPAVTVNPGDMIVGDKDGVVCVPKDLVEKVVELADLGRKIDALCLQDIITGKGVQASFKEHRGKTQL
ncbi:RraA-like protein [Cylindrobasidium torrendii FP15055 ss-10]|uniref:RraA-like protein n=1 Tax=Cylindrobasidium torrendii FP15055 ss-10 TaxID=1314674 RepID=A0A0D7BVC0_9AGAR|nr:RraA-like protein [Cylindrobasidium torrendii FP15055 ss-10]